MLLLLDFDEPRRVAEACILFILPHP
jgi:hypothetical protein